LVLKKEKISITNILNKKLNQDISLTEFFEENSKGFLDIPLCQYLKALIEKKGYTKAQVIRDSGINRRFFFDILSNKRKPSRNYVLRILIALQMPLKDVQWLLGATGYAQLYARDKHDSVIIYCINHQNSVNDCNAMLEKINLELI
jgi:transcriptional regulator with XRE-family HTH domain